MLSVIIYQFNQFLTILILSKSCVSIDSSKSIGTVIAGKVSPVFAKSLIVWICLSFNYRLNVKIIACKIEIVTKLHVFDSIPGVYPTMQILHQCPIVHIIYFTILEILGVL